MEIIFKSFFACITFNINMDVKNWNWFKKKTVNTKNILLHFGYICSMQLKIFFKRASLASEFFQKMQCGPGVFPKDPVWPASYPKRCNGAQEFSKRFSVAREFFQKA